MIKLPPLMISLPGAKRMGRVARSAGLASAKLEERSRVGCTT